MELDAEDVFMVGVRLRVVNDFGCNRFVAKDKAQKSAATVEIKIEGQAYKAYSVEEAFSVLRDRKVDEKHKEQLRHELMKLGEFEAFWDEWQDQFAAQFYKRWESDIEGTELERVGTDEDAEAGYPWGYPATWAGEKVFGIDRYCCYLHSPEEEADKFWEAWKGKIIDTLKVCLARKADREE